MGIGRFALMLYVSIEIFVIVLVVIGTLISGKRMHVLDDTDWWMFIVSCGILAICEALEEKKK